MKKQNTTVSTKLNALRKEIDAADQALLAALGTRFKSVKKVGSIKRANDLPVVQKNRWQEVVEDRLKRAKKLGVSEEFTRSLLKLIHKEAVRIQLNLKARNEK